ncbi:MAG: hypothetical protein ACXWJS_02450, partial [Hyphomicrobium sp.]
LLGSNFDARNGLGDGARCGLEFGGENVQQAQDDGTDGANNGKKPEQARHFAIPRPVLSLFAWWRHYDLL